MSSMIVSNLHDLINGCCDEIFVSSRPYYASGYHIDCDKNYISWDVLALHFQLLRTKCLPSSITIQQPSCYYQGITSHL